MNNITFEKMEEKYPNKGYEKFREVARLGGFGEPTLDHTGGIDPAYRGGLDLKGLEESDAVSKEDKAKIKAIINGGKKLKEQEEVKEGK
jgi:hypothetical protein